VVTELKPVLHAVSNVCMILVSLCNCYWSRSPKTPLSNYP